MTESLPLDAIFRAANSAALLSWIALITGPRRPWLLRGIGSAVVLGLCGVYTLLIELYFFRAEGGFFNLQAVQRLFDHPAVALAGWLHYLAFDLLAGLAIARHADAMGVSRWLQAPILATTFLFGPIGWLVFAIVRWFHLGTTATQAPRDGALA